jgi:nucleotide-binding universal stress UspA family protein
MSMKAILVHVDEHDSLEAVFASAVLAGRRFGSYLEGLHVRRGLPRMVPIVPEGAFMPTGELVEDREAIDQERGERLKARFDAFMSAHGIAQGQGPSSEGEVVAGWVEREPTGDEILGSLGRVYDLIVLGRPLEVSPLPAINALETALFESGRPLLIAPPREPQTLGETIVIAWNGSTETARTIALGMPFLRRAKEVVVLSVEDGMVPGPSGREVVQNLARNDVVATGKHVAMGDRSIGAAILEESTALGADLLIKGAYTHSRLRQMIFGGATSHILAAAEMPVFMAH